MILRVPPSDPHPTHEEIARRAYHLWEQEGRPLGHDQDHWQKAEHQLTALLLQEERALRHWEKASGVRAKQRKARA